MVKDFRRQTEDAMPPPLEEGYWTALLNSEDEEIEPEVPINYDISSEPALPRENIPQPVQALDKISDWEEISDYYESDRAVQLEVIGYNRGGLLVSWKTLHGFVPASQLLDPPDDHNGGLATRVGTQIKLRIIEMDQHQNRLILSERAAQVSAGTRHTILEELRPGDIESGIVTNLCDFGAFVDLGGLEGLIHISELSWGRVGHPDDVLKRGQKIDVYVMEIDKEQSRVALSIKRLRPDPWKTVEERYEVDQIVSGVVTNVVDFGAFVCIEEGLEGLIHVSELAEGHFLHPRNVVREGERVKLRILHIDGKARRLGLSLRQMRQNGHEEIPVN